MERSEGTQDQNQPLVEFAPEEAVLPALNQSAHPIEFTEANPVDQETVEPRTV
jgi:hypothetical protein